MVFFFPSRNPMYNHIENYSFVIQCMNNFIIYISTHYVIPFYQFKFISYQIIFFINLFFKNKFICLKK